MYFLLGVSILSLSTILIIDFEIGPIAWYFCSGCFGLFFWGFFLFFFHVINYSKQITN
jgi:hypothetical protein